MNIKPIPFAADLSVHPEIVPFFDAATNTISYIVHDPASPACAVIDPVLDFDRCAGRISHETAEAMAAHIRRAGWTLDWLIETGAHAGHLSAAAYLQHELGGTRGIGEGITLVQQALAEVFGGEDSAFHADGSQFDRLFTDGDSYPIGTMTAHVLATPGHSPACTTHVIGDAAFVGDTLFMPDAGSARTDFPGGDAATLYESIRRILALPEQMRLFVCHDHGAGGRAIHWETTVAEERAHNIHVRDGVDADAFVSLRRSIDSSLTMPGLLIPSLQVNIRGGHLPPADASGRTFLKLPVNAF